MAERVVQGDSISRDITSSTVTNFTGWVGSWGLYSTIGGTAIKSGALAISADTTRMECRIPPYDGIAVLPLGTVYLEMQVSNTALAFRRTLPQEKILIIAQGITP